MIGGAQGTGVDSSANVFARAAAAGGFHVYGKREYYSNIKGEHSYFQVRLSKVPIHSHVDSIDMLATFDEETVFRHALEVREGGAILYDPDLGAKRMEDVPTLESVVKERLNEAFSSNKLSADVNGMLELARRKGVHIYPIPYMDILKEVGKEHGESSLSSLARMVNMMAVAASYALLSYDQEIVKDSVRKQFRSKPKIAEMNADAVGSAYDFVKGKYDGGFDYKLERTRIDGERFYVRGNSVVAMAKELAGCRFQTYYPITPASDESEFLEAHEVIDLDGSSASAADNPQMGEVKAMQKGAIAVVQTEDEMSAITMAIGGGLAGVRSATSTSGPGFCLMAEGLGWAGMNEVPVVVTLYQRGGPSTGLPTRHEQGDLLFAIHAGHGEFPKLVLSSGDHEEAFYDTVRAFNYSERYQTPVVHVIDKALANSDATMSGFDVNRVKIDRGLLVRGDGSKGGNEEFPRFAFTPTGISPRRPVGTLGSVYWNTGDEHTEYGHITEEPFLRDAMMEKRMGKLALADREIPMAERVNFFGPEDADITIVSWGSTKGAILDALGWLWQDGLKVNFLQIRLIQPFPTEYVKGVLSKAKNIVGVEANYSGQLISVVREKTCIPVEQLVVKYNGRPMSSEELYYAIRQIAEGNAPKKVVLTGGA